MKDTFRESLIRHVQEFGTKVADLERATSVPRSIINKLLRRENRTTNVEDAIAIAQYYGKSVEEFIGSRADMSNVASISGLLVFLSAEELAMLESQLKGVVDHKHKSSKQQQAKLS